MRISINEASGVDDASAQAVSRIGRLGFNAGNFAVEWNEGELTTVDVGDLCVVPDEDGEL